MNDAVFGKNPPTEDAALEAESGEEEYVPPPAGPVLRGAFADEYESFEEDESAPREPQEDAPPLETGWNEELPKISPAQQREVPVDDMWGAPAPIPKLAENPQPPKEQPKAKAPPKASVGKAPWEEDGEEEEAEAVPASFTQTTQPVLRTPEPEPEPIAEIEPEPAPAPIAINENEEAVISPAAEARWQVEPAEKTVTSPDTAQPEITQEEDTFPTGPKLSIPEHMQMPEPAQEEEPEAIEEIAPPPLPPPPAAAPAYAPPPRQEPMLSEVQAALLEVVELHHQWLGTGGKEGRRAIITGTQFHGADFSGLYLAEASFRHAKLPATRFEGANLERVDFTEANLEAADFSASVLNQANFQRAQLGQADFTDTQANEADFTGAELVGAILIRTQLEWAIFCDALLSEADLRQANLEKANLRSASLFRARLEGANLSQADCRNANFDQAQMDDTVLQQTNLHGSHVPAEAIQQTDFSQANAVPVEAVNNALEQEREWLQQEATRLEKLKLALEYREQQLEEAAQAQPEAFAPAPTTPSPRYDNSRSIGIDTSYIQQLLSKNGKLFMKLAIVWLVVSLLVLSISLSAFEVMDSSQLNFIELLLFAFIFFSPPALCLMTMIKSNKLAQTLERLSGESPEES